MAQYDINGDMICSNGSSSSLKLKTPVYSIVSEANYVEPVTVDEFKQFAAIDYASDDLLITEILKAARKQSEAYLQRSLGVRTVRFRASECPENYFLSWGTIETINTTGYTLLGDYLVEGGTNIDIEYVSNAGLVNYDTKLAINILALQLYDKRERFLNRVRETGAAIDLWKEKLNPYKKIQFP